MLTGRALRSSMIKTVTKRSGFTVDYDRTKIRNAIAGANKDSVQKMRKKDIMQIIVISESENPLSLLFIIASKP